MTGVGARVTIAVGLLALVPVAGGCGGFEAPTTLEECRASASDGGGDGELWTVAYDEADRPLGASGTVYACVGDMPGSVVSVDPPAGVVVEPGEVTAPVGGGVVELAVTVTGDEDVTLELHLDGGADGSATHWVDLDVDDDEWSFAQPDGRDL
ncbi:hypothetical protein [Nocardioides terrigena]|uniref:hypothetical protein n=1 Tax=Nocardioides terrigena TaxID=424797 RepID=UPI000D306C92|nr:hypothetical protein [Nocardioides terrigena]